MLSIQIIREKADVIMVNIRSTKTFSMRLKLTKVYKNETKQSSHILHDRWTQGIAWPCANGKMMKRMQRNLK